MLIRSIHKMILTILFIFKELVLACHNLINGRLQEFNLFSALKNRKERVGYPHALNRLAVFQIPIFAMNYTFLT